MQTRKATALLAFLSISEKPQSREKLAALFWPEFDQTRAHANLRRTLASIIQTFGSGILLSNRDIIGIDPDAQVWSDVSEFCSLQASIKAHAHQEKVCPECIDHLEKAVSLYRGDFLEGFSLKDCPEFDEWQLLQAQGLRSDLVALLETLTGVYSANREWEKAILRSRQWVSLDRLHEPAHRWLMQVYALSGQRSAAIRQFEECEHWLQVDLGQSPEKETTALYQQIRTGKIGNQGALSQAAPIPPPATPVNQPLIKTKLFIPHRHPGLVSRQHLFVKLEQGAQRALTLISAPAGYGKSTLLSEWIDSLQKAGSSPPWAVCWFSLDPGDNDPIRFLTYLTTALEQAHPGVGAETRTVIQSSNSLHPATPLSMLINELQDLPQSVLLVLDDYQCISNPAIHDGITFLLDHLPLNVHVVIATRSDPPLPLARLRACNQLTEMRAYDLCFTAMETTQFFHQVCHLALTPEQITVLANRTEGWIAGLQMAALSMQGRSDLVQFISAFSGSHRFIMDYLAEETLNRQPVEIREFLLKTSILEQLSEPLCDFVLTDQSEHVRRASPSSLDYAIVPGETQSRLTQLERSNLFIVPLDDERVWYRYHHLFADLLRTYLQHLLPELAPILHTRASVWLENNGWIEEAIQHALAAKDWQNAARLMTDHIPTYLENGKMVTILQWIDDLPQDEIFRNPKLSALVAEVYSQAGRIDHIDPYLNQAEAILVAREKQGEGTRNGQEWELSPKEITTIHSMIWILRGLKAVCSGDPQRAITFTQKASNDIPEMEPKERAVLHWVTGWAYRSLGNLHQAIDSLTKATEYALESGAILRDIWTDLANVTRLVGKLPQARDIIRDSLQMAAERGIQNQGNLSRDESFLSFIFLEQNELDLALTHAHRAIDYIQWWPSHNIIATAYTSLAQILLIQEDLAGSMQAIQKADVERKNRLMTPHVHSLVDIALVQIWLTQGEWSRLDPWSSDQISTLNTRVATGGLIDEYLEMRLIVLVRVWMKKTMVDRHLERDEECLRLLAQLETSSRSAGRVNSLVEVLILKASIQFSHGKTSAAMDCLDECLTMAEAGGYMRIFLDTGEPARALLSAYLQQVNPIHEVYTLKILQGFCALPQARGPLDDLPEPLTSREVVVLQLLAQGFSNRQMADKLVLAEGTIKYHVHNLLGKLQVESRTQAIAKAKDLELI
ncbi:MAG: BTAD domain-containing putative transcriptional regulator [Anaerolineaceae bacterium]|nr:BTAD domain-containing putative transcriptional regulator [Anaerolineaceae bacterium]